MKEFENFSRERERQSELPPPTKYKAAINLTSQLNKENKILAWLKSKQEKRELYLTEEPNFEKKESNARRSLESSENEVERERERGGQWDCEQGVLLIYPQIRKFLKVN